MERQRITTYEEAVSYLLAIPRFTTKHTLEETKDFLHLLGDPDQRLCIIHVAGTNGKGSVCAYLRFVLETAGKRVAVFTSPHLVDIRERFLMEGCTPSKEEFLKAFFLIYDKLDWAALERGGGYHPTFFEYLFFMAMEMFAEKMPDFCILETGLGGRLDATNSVARKMLTVITRIGLDHMEYLGNTIGAIAGEKAGIMRKNCPVVYADVESEASEVFRACAKKLQISAYPVSKRDYTILNFKKKTIDFLFAYRYHKNIEVSLHTIALYQVENAALALRSLSVLEELGELEELSEDTLRQGMWKCFWAGRMEEVLPEVYVDGAHNADGIRAFVETVARDNCENGRLLLFSAVADKDYGQMLRKLADSGLFERIGIAHMRSGRAASLTSLREVLERYSDCPCTTYETVEEALETMLSERGKKRLYIAGSLYLAGEIKELVGRLHTGDLEGSHD